MADGLEKRSGSGFFGSLSRLSLGGSSTPSRKESSSAPAYDPSVDTLRPEDDVGEADKSEEVRRSPPRGPRAPLGPAAGGCGCGWHGRLLTPPPVRFRLAPPPPHVQVIDESNVPTGFVPESEKSSFLSFVKKAMGGIDLSRITAPPFILAPQSQLETNAELMSHPDVFCGCARRRRPSRDE